MVLKRFFFVLTAVSIFISLSSPVYSSENRHPLFMRELAQWVELKLSDEQKVRKLVREELGETPSLHEFMAFFPISGPKVLDLNVYFVNTELFHKCLAPDEADTVMTIYRLMCDWVRGLMMEENVRMSWLEDYNGKPVTRYAKSPDITKTKLLELTSPFKNDYPATQGGELSFNELMTPGADAAIDCIATEHRRFMKEFGRYMNDRLDREDELRAAIRDIISSNKDDWFREGPSDGSEMLPIYKLVYDGLLCDGANAGRIDDFVRGNLELEDRNVYDKVAQAMGYWVFMVTAEEKTRLKYGSDALQEKIAESHETETPETLNALIRSKIRPYLLQKLSDEDLKKTGFSDLLCRD